MNNNHKDLMKVLTHARATIAEGRLLREMIDKSTKGDTKGLKEAVESDFLAWTEKKLSVSNVECTLLKFATSASLGKPLV